MTIPTACAACGTTGTGRFCSSCGAMLGGSACAECGTPMSPGARFCHRCGASTIGGASTLRKSTDTAVPWAVAAIAMVALIALVAGRRFGGTSPTPEGTPLSAATSEGIVRGPDISQMTPAQRAELLLDRVDRLTGAGHVDSVRFFAPMAIASFQMIDSITDEQRFDLGRIGLLAGLSDVARAQAETILAKRPDHVLGLTLAFDAAQFDHDSASERSLKRRLLAVAGGRRQPVSKRHEAYINQAVRKANP